MENIGACGSQYDRKDSITMIIQCREKDREMLLAFLEEDAEYNAPVIRELESCSFDEKQHLVYAEVEKEECVVYYA